MKLFALMTIMISATLCATPLALKEKGNSLEQVSSKKKKKGCGCGGGKKVHVTKAGQTL